MSASIVIRPYQASWPQEFAVIEARLRGALGSTALRIDHIGSTAVPGLAAKDVIDVQVAVADLDDPALIPAFASLGAATAGIVADHAPAGDESAPEAWAKRMFRVPEHWRRTHLHVRVLGQANFRYALLFRDYLRADPAATQAYAQIKVALARLYPHDAEAYYDVKDPVCDLVIGAAERWAEQSGWAP